MIRYFIILILLTSCTAEWHIRRAIVKTSPQDVLNMITTKYPEFIKTRIDTIRDTTYIIHDGYDTTIVTQSKDTIILKDIKIFKNYDTIRVLRDVKIDTVVKTITIPKYIVTQKIDNSTMLTKILWILFALIILILLLFAIFKQLKI